MSLKSTLSTPIRKPKNHEGSWAVSYADFLMVLLSFFIVFFSIDRKTALHEIVTKMTSVAGGNSGSGTLPGELATITPAAHSASLEAIAKLSPFAKITQAKAYPNVRIDFPDDLYAPGGYATPTQALAPVIDILKNYSHLRITVIGHSDAVPFVQGRPVIGRSDFILAAVRGAYAAVHLQRALPKSDVLIQSAISDSKNVRSLTLVISDTSDPQEDSP